MDLERAWVTATGSGLDAGSRETVGGDEDDPQGSWRKAKAPGQSEPRSRVWQEVMVTEVQPSSPFQVKEVPSCLFSPVSFPPVPTQQPSHHHPQHNYVSSIDHIF